MGSEDTGDELPQNWENGPTTEWSDMGLVAVSPCCDASRMAILYALRKDWAPKTAPWQPWMQEALFTVAAELDAEARMYHPPNPFEDLL